jgi:hypothetical protein
LFVCSTITSLIKNAATDHAHSLNKKVLDHSFPFIHSFQSFFQSLILTLIPVDCPGGEHLRKRRGILQLVHDPVERYRSEKRKEIKNESHLHSKIAWKKGQESFENHQPQPFNPAAPY